MTSSSIKAAPFLFRSTTDRKVKGVCGGIAEKFGWDPSLVRLAFIAGTFFLMTQVSGLFFFSYVIAAIVLNDKPAITPAPTSYTFPITVTDADLI
jgi:phage shock protein C